MKRFIKGAFLPHNHLITHFSKKKTFDIYFSHSKSIIGPIANNHVGFLTISDMFEWNENPKHEDNPCSMFAKLVPLSSVKSEETIENLMFTDDR